MPSCPYQSQRRRVTLRLPCCSPCDCGRCRQEQLRHRQRKRDERQELVRTIHQLTERLSTLEADRDRLAHQNQLLLKVEPSVHPSMLSASQRSQRACCWLQVHPCKQRVSADISSAPQFDVAMLIGDSAQ